VDEIIVPAMGIANIVVRSKIMDFELLRRCMNEEFHSKFSWFIFSHACTPER
jgi:hypothetical protein